MLILISADAVDGCMEKLRAKGFGWRGLIYIALVTTGIIEGLWLAVSNYYIATGG